MTREMKASFAFIERNFHLTRRYWAWEIAFLVYSVAGALSISLIGEAQGDRRLLFTLMIGAIFWNYLSVTFSWIAETIAVERWEGTLEYTMMAPIRRSSQLVGSVAYAIVYGLVHTAAMLLVLSLFFGLDLVSGVYYPISILPGWMQVLAHLSPATYILDGVRAALIEGVGFDRLLGDVWPLVVMAIVLIPVGVWGFGRAEAYAKRTGKLKRVG